MSGTPIEPIVIHDLSTMTAETECFVPEVNVCVYVAWSACLLDLSEHFEKRSAAAAVQKCTKRYLKKPPSEPYPFNVSRPSTPNRDQMVEV